MSLNGEDTRVYIMNLVMEYCCNPLLSSQVTLSHYEWTVVTKAAPRNALPNVAGNQACAEPPAFSLHDEENHAEVPAIEEDRRVQILEQGSVALPEDHASIGRLRHAYAYTYQVHSR